MPNRLIHETSPYLLQHANNPVDWYTWSDEAIQKARQEGKPIFLSIGYAACHWCHVMERESFENEETAAVLNRHFVSIKVDREERPDLDSIYMGAVTAMTGQGGWPMSVFLTPDLKPFYGGTYFPPVRRYNMPSFIEVLEGVIQAWQTKRDDILQASRQITEHLHQSSAWETSQAALHPLAGQVVRELQKRYDWQYGGWGQAPKFPAPMTIEFLLMQAEAGNSDALSLTDHALQAMSLGGLYDVIGGGFHRYSTDNEWLVPHFEKMLYDNAQLALAYLHGYLVTGKTEYRSICTGTLDFILRELRDPQGGFYSSLDADSEGEEGKFYVWSPAELMSALQNGEDQKILQAVYEMPAGGNFEGGKIILKRTQKESELTARYEDSLPDRVKSINDQLYSIRSQRVWPAVDDKVLTFWNALALIAFAEAARYLDRPDYLQAAQANAHFILNNLYQKDRLFRSWRNGHANHNAYLEDYAALILGMLSLYQTDFDITWYQWALTLNQEMITHFSDPDGGFYATRKDQAQLLLRPKEIQDNATPSGNALAARALYTLSFFEEKPEWRSLAENMVASVQDFITRYPTAFSYWLQVHHLAVHPLKQIAILSPQTHSTNSAFINELNSRFRPSVIVAASVFPPPQGAPNLLAGRPLLEGLTTAYVCQNFVCLQPVNSPDQFRQQLSD